MIRSIKDDLCQRGFDLCHPIHTSWYNQMIKDEGLVENNTLKMMPEPSAILDGEEGEKCNALLIGNTKKTWPVFLDWLACKVEEKKIENSNFTTEDALEHISSPFDTFVKESILQAIQRCVFTELNSCELFWSSGKRHNP